MFQMPEQYYLHKKFDVKSIIPKGIKYNEKKRMQDNVKQVKLDWQLSGEQVPSRIDDEINCKVIMFFSIELTSLKHASFIADLLQRHLKGFVILRLYDREAEVYSFAIKRLHATQKNEIVIEELFLTNKLPLVYAHTMKNLLQTYVTYEAVNNKLDKYNFYLEVATKAFIISQAKSFQRFEKLLNHNQHWLDKNVTKKMLERYKTLVELKNMATRQMATSEKIKLNAEIKKHLNYLNSLLEE